MTIDQFSYIEKCLIIVCEDIKLQCEIALTFSPDELPYDSWIEQLDEWINYACEYSLAYESIVSSIENHPFRLSGEAVVKLLEVALLLRYKTDRESDCQFDFR